MIPSNALPGDFYLVSFDGKNPNLHDPDNWLKKGGAIRIGQWAAGEGFAQYEHAGIYVNGGMVIEAANTGTVMRPWRYDGNDVMWSSGIIDLDPMQRMDIIKAAHGYIGTPYSWPDYWALAAHHLHLDLADAKLKAYVSSTKHMICSQLVDQCYEDAGVHLFNDGRWPGYVMPGSLYHLLLANKAHGV